MNEPQDSEEIRRLLRHEQRLVRLQELILDSASEGIFGVDHQGRCIFANLAAAKATGFDVAELLGQSQHDLTHHTRADGTPYPPKECPIYAAYCDNQTHRVVHEVFWRKDGTSFPVEYTTMPVSEDGHPVGAVVVFRDVSERQRAQADLRESEERFRAFLGNCPAAAFIKDEQGRYLFGNQTWKDQFREDPGSFLGKTDFDLWPTETAQLFRQSDLAALQAGHPIQVQESAKGIGGETHHWAVFKFPVRGANGQRLVGGFAVDLSESLQAEEERRQLEEQLRQSQRMDAIGQLAGGVAHDFNNLLGIILGFNDLVKEHLQIGTLPHRYSEEISKAGQRAATLTRQLLAFSRKQAMKTVVFNLNTVVTATTEMLERLIGHDIELSLGTAANLGLVKADPGQIEQVLMNLVINARSAMPEGGKLRIETGNVDLDETRTHWHLELDPGPYVMLAVSDTGCGMDEATRARIFEPFFTTKPQGQGTGLGLSTVYGIVRQSGGSIWVYSEPGKGSTFKIFLPQVSASPPEVVAGAPGPEHQLTPSDVTILVVEDEDSLRKLMRQVLESQGYTVLAATTGEDALELSGSFHQPIQLLLADVVLPGMNGAHLAGRLTALRPQMKVLYVSGYLGTAMEHGVIGPASSFLEKPFSRQELLDRVRRALLARDVRT